MKYVIRNMPDKLAVVPTMPAEVFATTEEARRAIEARIAPLGYTRVKIAEEGPDDYGSGEWRVTATTPGGRAGRNVAFIEADYQEEFNGA